MERRSSARGGFEVARVGLDRPTASGPAWVALEDVIERTARSSRRASEASIAEVLDAYHPVLDDPADANAFRFCRLRAEPRPR